MHPKTGPCERSNSMNQHDGSEQDAATPGALPSPRTVLAAAVAAAAMLAAVPGARPGLVAVERFRAQERGPADPREPVYRDPQPPSQYPPSQDPPQSIHHPSSRLPALRRPPTGRPRTRSVSSSSSASSRKASAPASRATRCRSSKRTSARSIRSISRASAARAAQLLRIFPVLEVAQAHARLRRPRQQKDQAKRQLADLEAQRQQIAVSSEQSYRDDIVRELARNNCGANYEQEARRQDGGSSSSIWQDDEGGNYGGWSPYGRLLVRHLPHGVRPPVRRLLFPDQLLDAAEPFRADEAVCQSKCAAPVELYYYQNPGAAVDQSVGLAHAGALYAAQVGLPLPQGVGARLLVQGGRVQSAEQARRRQARRGRRATGDAGDGLGNAADRPNRPTLRPGEASRRSRPATAAARFPWLLRLFLGQVAEVTKPRKSAMYAPPCSPPLRK